jgi:hypothetical protein
LEQKLPLYSLNNSDRRLSTEDSIARVPILEQDNGENPLISLLKGRAETSESKEENPIDKQNTPSPVALFAELFRNIKDSLKKIKSFAHLSREKFGDPEYADYFYKTISKDIVKTEAVLNCFDYYSKISSPLPRTNRVHLLLEEALQYYENEFEDKKIKVFKKRYEGSLPETDLHDEQLRFLINSVLQYAVPSIPFQRSIGFLTRPLEAQEAMERGTSPLQKDEKYVEILTGFTGYQSGSQPLETALPTPAPPHKERDDFMLHLVAEMIERNQGMMRIKVEDEKLITMISLILPMERGRTLHYLSTTA